VAQSAAIVEACPRHVGFTAEILLGSGKEIICFGPPTWNYRPHKPRVIEDGDIVSAEVFSSLGMLETQHQPTVAVGKVHADYERAAEVARASYEEGLKALRPGATFGKVVEAMQAPLKKAGGYNLHPLIHSINPFGMICGFGEGFARLPGAKRYARFAPYRKRRRHRRWSGFGCVLGPTRFDRVIERSAADTHCTGGVAAAVVHRVPLVSAVLARLSGTH
jgi:Xaa-Pro dipeptidase